jgi:argonaute-like protein implicated in RNA metabolism and viral defense
MSCPRIIIKLRGYTKKEAWKMTCRSVHRILDDLQGARMTGRDAGDGSDLDRVTATYIWATAKAHEVMDDYLKYQFFEHPAIAAVLARHLAATAVLPDDQLSSKFRNLETTVTKLLAKVDGIQSKVNQKKVIIADPPTDGTSPVPTTFKSLSKNGYRGGNN